jgi:hypothetical protein
MERKLEWPTYRVHSCSPFRNAPLLNRTAGTALAACAEEHIFPLRVPATIRMIAIPAARQADCLLHLPEHGGGRTQIHKEKLPCL